MGLNVYYKDNQVSLLQGDVRDVLKQLPTESVQCVVTSPPYWGLRDYGTATWEGGDAECGHRHQLGGEGSASAKQNTSRGTQTLAYAHTCGKCGARRIDSQLGLEATPEEFVANMVDVFREVKRVLRKDGTCWVNMGDSYNANTGAGFNGNKRLDKANRDTVMARPFGLAAKQLIGMPWRLAFALQADGWWLRSDIIWAKPNPMPESVTDRPTKSHEYVFLLTKSATYYYDADAVREAFELSSWTATKEQSGELARGQNGIRSGVKGAALADGVAGSPFGKTSFANGGYTQGGRNKRTVWTIATQPYSEAHFATFPEKLVEPCILAGTSEWGACSECGAPWERVVESTSMVLARSERTHELGRTRSSGTMLEAPTRTTTGWRPTCTHDAPRRPCVVLDPFLGSGTTLQVARNLGRRGLGIELSVEYLAIAKRRLFTPFERAVQELEQ